MSFYILIHSFIVKTHLNDDFPWVLLQFLVLTSDTKTQQRIICFIAITVSILTIYEIQSGKLFLLG